MREHPETIQGFTLVELMIVVVIIGVLAAMAVPQLLKFQLRSKHAEVDNVLGGIFATEEAFAAKWGTYGEFGPQPPGAMPTGRKLSWDSCPNGAPPTGHCVLGYRPQGQTYFQYTAGAGDTFSVGSEAFPTPSAQLQLGGTTQGYPCVGGGDCTSPAPAGVVPATIGVIDITMGARGDLDNDGSACLYLLTDEVQRAKPSPASCGDATF